MQPQRNADGHAVIACLALLHSRFHTNRPNTPQANQNGRACVRVRACVHVHTQSSQRARPWQHAAAPYITGAVPRSWRVKKGRARWRQASQHAKQPHTKGLGMPRGHSDRWRPAQAGSHHACMQAADGASGALAIPFRATTPAASVQQQCHAPERLGGKHMSAAQRSSREQHVFRFVKAFSRMKRLQPQQANGAAATQSADCRVRERARGCAAYTQPQIHATHAAAAAAWCY